MSLRFHLFVFDVNQREQRFLVHDGGFNIFLRGPGMERFSLGLP